MDKIISEQKLQSSESMDEETATRVGKIIGAQAIISGEIAVASAESSKYEVAKERCLEYYKNGRCATYRYYKQQCEVTKATVSANINILNVETGMIIYGDAISKNYNVDSCKISLSSSEKIVLSKAQALDRLASLIATEFAYKLTPKYVYFSVALLNNIKLKAATSNHKKTFDIALDYIKASRYDKAKKILEKLMKETDGNSYVISYTLGVIYEATGDLEKAKKFYNIADDKSMKSIDEINLAINRIDDSIEKANVAIKQINAK
jgi:tetratricopeptide (TPR) repeat protein